MPKILPLYPCLLLLLVCLCLSSCASVGGGGDYKYERFNPATGEKIQVAVHSVRKVGQADIHFSPDGTVDIKTRGIQPGPNNLGQALEVTNKALDLVIKADAATVVP